MECCTFSKIPGVFQKQPAITVILLSLLIMKHILYISFKKPSPENSMGYMVIMKTMKLVPTTNPAPGNDSLQICSDFPAQICRRFVMLKLNMVTHIYRNSIQHFWQNVLQECCVIQTIQSHWSNKLSLTLPAQKH